MPKDATQQAWISKEWINEWKSKKNLELDESLTADITCEHGNLGVDEDVRRLIPKEVWDYLCTFYTGTFFDGNTQPCAECSKLEKERQEEEEQIRAIKAVEKEQLASFAVLIQAIQDILIPETSKVKPEVATEAFKKYYRNIFYPQVKGQTKNSKKMAEQIETVESKWTLCLISLDWCLRWLEHINSSSSQDKPGPVDNSKFVCQHDGLQCDVSPTLLSLTSDDNTPSQIDYDHEYVLITESSWNVIHDKYNSSHDTLRVLVTQDKDGQFSFQFDPSLCEEGCQQHYQQKIAQQRLDYHDKTFNVILRDKPKQETKENEWVAVGGRRKNKQFNNNPSQRVLRSQQKDQNEKKVAVQHINCTDTLQELKLKIFEATEIPPLQQRISLDDQPNAILSSDDLTLAQCNITLKSIVVVEKLEEENIEFLDDVVKPEVEEGFKGTGLLGYSKRKENQPEQQPPACSACTFINEHGSKTCSMCGNDMTKCQCLDNEPQPVYQDTKFDTNDNTQHQENSFMQIDLNFPPAEMPDFAQLAVTPLKRKLSTTQEEN
mmetsp:Transcript_4816/g.6723  ORF Transcript_4816/g.6723 Transcript_4816/m.6723 type:complete len:547 (+) Transcript_4816:1487-3127(+)